MMRFARPILVTGMPRSGTTWLARQLAGAPRAAMAGREPMNARNTQYALGGTIDGWARIRSFTPRQSRILKSAYCGLNPWVYGRYGCRQWLAPLPWVRRVIKDPFALLSLPAIVSETNADVVIVYRHPAAVLASWRRMGWTAKHNEVFWAESLIADGQQPSDGAAGDDDLGLLARLWNALHKLLLEDIANGVPVHIVAHEDVGLGGADALRVVFDAVGLRWAGQGGGALEISGEVVPGRLHNLDREPSQVARSWIRDTDDEDLARLDRITGPVLAELKRLRLLIPGTEAAPRGTF